LNLGLIRKSDEAVQACGATQGSDLPTHGYMVLPMVSQRIRLTRSDPNAVCYPNRAFRVLP